MIAPGTRLGAYRVDTLVGEGGMGQVYRGVDTRLDRPVAIKVLPRHLSSQAELRERFEREARAISSLSHPNICTLFDVGSESGTEYLVMEFVEGETLADRLARGSMPVDQLIRYGCEIAEALAAAHRRGIVHRDLKPGNVMLTKAGAKLLDFGLARTAGIIIGADAPTEHQKPLTAEGTLLGTFQYMAPEQVEGGEVDARTDIFALGAVLYEMATGRRAFDGKSKASVIASILDRDPPPIASIESTASAALDRLIRACLAKNPDDRVQSARDVAMQLRWIGEGNGGSEVASRRSRRGSWLAVAGALALVAAVAALAVYQRQKPAGSPGVHLTFLPPPGYDIASAAVGPDGSIAFAAQKGSERFVFVRALNEDRPRQLAKIEGSGHPFWSPDGKWIAYFGLKKLMKVPVAGGTPEAVADSSYGLGGVWTERDTIVYTPSYYKPLHVVSARGGEAKPLTALDAKRGEVVHAWPVVLPRNLGILYLSETAPSERARIFHVPVDGGKATDVIEADAIAGYSEPWLLFVRNAGIYAVRFDAAKLRVEGEPRRIAEEAAFKANDSSAFASVNAAGVLLYAARSVEKRRFVAYDRNGIPVATLFEDEDIGTPRISADGKRVLVSKFMHESGTYGVYRVDLERGTRTFLTPAPRFGWGAVWLPDGERFVFTSSMKTADFDLHIQADDPQAQPAVLWEGRSDDKEALSVAPDGRHLLAREFLPETQYDLVLVPLDGGPPKPLVRTPAGESWGDLSPDGKWVAYQSDVSGRLEIYLRRVDGGRSIQVSTSGGSMPRFSPDGGELYFVSPARAMMAAALTRRGEALAAAVPTQLFRLDPTGAYRWDLSADGKTFNILEDVGGSRSGGAYNVRTGWKQALEE